MNDDWDVIKTILHDELNDDFDFPIDLRARSYESTDDIFEEFDVLPYLLACLKLNWVIWLYIKIKLDSDLLYTLNREITRLPLSPSSKLYNSDFSASYHHPWSASLR
jgi:hypothetical protein